MVWDVAVIGAGMAGLTCAARLQQMGYRVGVVEKSRGLGGRLATRRLSDAWADHGVRYLEDQGDYTRRLIRELLVHQCVHAWTAPVWHWQESQTWQPEAIAHPRYVSSEGLTLAAKYLARDLEILRGQRAVRITLTNPVPEGDHHSPQPPWQLSLEPLTPDQRDFPQIVTARAIVLAVPAPQAAELLKTLIPQGIAQDLWARVEQVEYAPCITAIATYPESLIPEAAQLSWGGLQFPKGHAIAWVGLEHRKRETAHPSAEAHSLASHRPVVVVQSQSQFAQQYLDVSELQPVGEELLHLAAAAIAPWLAQPELVQVHRWRYAFVARPLPETYLLSLQPQLLVCCGDWCGGDRMEQALQSGEAAAIALASHLKRDQAAG